MNNLNELKLTKPSTTLVVTRKTTLLELTNFVAHLPKKSQSQIILKTAKRLRTQLTVNVTI
jgi:hypothetical protein